MKTSYIRNKIWLTRNRTSRLVMQAWLTIRRKSRLYRRKISSESAGNDKGLTFAILCVKRPEYVRMAIEQANSLWYFNPNHHFVIYADDICLKELNRLARRLDYPEKISIRNDFGRAELPWQKYKIGMCIEASRRNQSVVDADTIWHGDVSIDSDQIIMLSRDLNFGDDPDEKILVEKILNKPEWLGLPHYVSAFVHIPAELMTDNLANDIHSIADSILGSPLEEISMEKRDHVRRLAEEIALSLALQKQYPGRIKTLKASGSRKDHDTLEPLYYGVSNRIMD